MQAILFLVGIGLIIWGVLGMASEMSQYNIWAADCRSKGGIVQEESMGFLSTRYECYKDGKILHGIKMEDR